MLVVGFPPKHQALSGTPRHGLGIVGWESATENGISAGPVGCG